MTFVIPKHIHPSVQDAYERNSKLDPRIVKLGQQLQNAAFADTPHKQVPPDQCPAPMYMEQAISLTQDVVRRKNLIATLSALHFGG